MENWKVRQTEGVVCCFLDSGFILQNGTKELPLIDIALSHELLVHEQWNVFEWAWLSKLVVRGIFCEF